jgi:nucleotide-binding universal stress UspA family protein
MKVKKGMKVLMCTDGSRFAEEAIESGGLLLKGMAPKVTLLRVIPDFVTDYEEYNEFVEVFREEIHRLRKQGVPKSVRRSLEAGKGILERMGIKAETKVREGKAADEILKEGEEGAYDLIVVASYGRGISKFFLGSVSREIVHRSRIPVLVMKSRESQT